MVRGETSLGLIEGIEGRAATQIYRARIGPFLQTHHTEEDLSPNFFGIEIYLSSA